ncbi:hypothetical protein CQ019_16815 [Arthrobacter sp. MYb229]|uniref:lipopolysaccharide biosynthesis protein n=1 Tax=unclassified Arthrobacter TaxID=235627 RepID=UPI000CFAB736|nr:MULTISPECIES: oligosaccharide flippase family protein [unclassified Arthrobacter]PQZ99211.1 hypothetical protein CQ019_16815 [Arthrobacter sp. MYb229]PRB47596.1 hypothetical protein CQ013_16840 [Arthrobacter sp. MYb216]
MAAQLQLHLAGIARSGSLNVLGAAVAALLNFAFIVVVTQSFEQRTAGALFTATSIFVIALSICSLGTDAGLARFLMRYQALDRMGHMPLVLRAARNPVLCCALLLALAGSLLSGHIAATIGLHGTEGQLTIILLMLLLPMAALGDLSLAAARALGTVQSTVLSEKLLRPVLQPLGALAVAAMGGSLIWLTASWAIPYAVAAGLSVVLFRRVFRPYRSTTAPARPEVRAVAREFWTFSWPRAISRISQSIVQRADIVIVAALIGPAEAAVYTAATRFVALGQFGVHAIQQVLQPRFSQLLAMDQIKTLEAVFKTATSWNMGLAWPLYITAIVGVDHYLMLFGPDYGTSSARMVVLVMGLALMLGTAAGPLDTMLLMSGRSTTSLVISLLGLAANIGLCFVFVPAFGLQGAAFAWGTAIVLRNVLTFFGVFLALRINPFSGQAALIAVLAILSFGGPVLPVALSGTHAILPFAIALGAGVLMYLAALWVFRRRLRLTTFRHILPKRKSGQAKG